ncbi:MAG: hypothetical protein U0167_14250 [bacterium]
MAFYRGTPFARVGDVLLALMGVPDLLSGTEVRVLLFLAKHANWKPELQGGVPGTFVSARALAEESAASESSVERALARYGSEPFREKRKNGVDVADRRPLSIVRDATEDESSGVMEAFMAREGRPPKVRVFRHPRYWTLPKWAEAEFRKRLSPKLRAEIWPNGEEETR